MCADTDSENDRDPGSNADTKIQNKAEPPLETPWQASSPAEEPAPHRGARTDLEVGVGSQGLVDQSVTLRVPWTQVHDVTLSLLVRQGHRGELARSGRNWG